MVTCARDSMNRSVFPIIAIITIVLLTSSGSCANSKPVKSGLAIPSATSSVGGNTNNPADQIFFYTITLQNTRSTEVTVNYIEPILLDPFATKAKGNDFRVTVDKSIDPGATIEISGEIQFDATGMTKEEIMAMQPFFGEININTDEMLAVTEQTLQYGMLSATE